ncbi:MAG: FtsW/RodA/SpoVE family cell cycle protein, partial [Firmicutes bacterium]|nr:FtsW/RodA/SpoVE family cell cycle protein [Bacillota bacterium]
MNGSFSDILQRILLYFQYFRRWAVEDKPGFGEIYIHVIRWIMPILALFIVLSVIRRMMRVKNPRETWGHLVSDDLGRFTITHWECTVGRARHCDIIVRFATISRTQCALIRDDSGQWYVHDLSGRNTTTVNGKVVREKTPINHKDVLSIGGIEFRFYPLSAAEHERMKQRRKLRSQPIAPWSSMVLLTIFQALTMLEFRITRPDSAGTITFCFIILCAAMWFYTFLTRLLGQRGFEAEILAFFACTLNLAVTATSNTGIMMKQTIAIVLGMIFFICLGWYLRDIDRVVKTRRVATLLTIALFAFNLVFGVTKYGAANWVKIAGVSLQPSELAKVFFIFAGAATLDRLFVKQNLMGFMILSGVCLGSLAIMGDFGTAAIFFVVFLVIAFLRSGDFATLSLITGAAAGAALLVIRFKPYVASRFMSWGHAWDNVNTPGYQQVRTMSASASGGLIGVGGG